MYPSRTLRPAVLGLTVGALAAGGLVLAPAASAAPADARITEIHYDNAGDDAGEAIEITAPSAADLTGLRVVLYNGSSTSLKVYDDDPVVSDGDAIAVVTYPRDGIQNGAPDGVALVGPDNTVIEFVSYEGTFTAADGPAAGRTSVDIGVDETSSTPAGQSLQRTPGTDTWTGPAASTFDAPNDGSGTPGDGTPGDGSGTGPACDATVVSIGSLQGVGDGGSAAGTTATVRGTVVGDLQQGGFDGVFVQDAGDGDPATSDGIFVYGGSMPALEPGDTVTVTGTVKEYNGLTELDRTSVSDCGAGTLPEAAALQLPATDEQREALEGMLVAPTEDLTVTEVYNLNRYGEIMLAQGGRLITPTEEVAPGPEATARVAENAARSLLLDDGLTANLSTSKQAPPFLTVDDPVRVGDTARLEPVVLSYGFDAWRLEPADGTADGTTFDPTNPRPEGPAEVGGDLRIADFNVLNYFVDFPSEFGDQARGAANAAELAEQQAKIVSAITALGADVITLHEIENSAVLTPNTPYRAVETLLGAIEAADGHDWDYVRAHEDTDVITNAIVFRTDRVTAVGAPRVPTDEQMAAFDNARTPIAQTFRAGDEVFSVIANHLKSKGSSCGSASDDPSVGGAGNCNGDRVAQAEVLRDFAATVAQESGDDDVLLTGDFNSYRYEQPLDVLREAGFREVFTPGEYSYVFDGGSGSLDHVFATPSMFPKISGHTVWDINAVESFGYEYDGYEPLYAPYPYRASDHNPTVVGLTTEEVAATAAISDPQPFRGDRVTVTGSGFAAGTAVRATLPARDGQVLGTGTAGPDGTVSIAVTVPAIPRPGSYDVVLTAADGETAATSFTLRPIGQEVAERILGHAPGR